MPPQQLLRALCELPTGRPAIDARVARVLRRLEHHAERAAPVGRSSGVLTPPL